VYTYSHCMVHSYILCVLVEQFSMTYKKTQIQVTTFIDVWVAIIEKSIAISLYLYIIDMKPWKYLTISWPNIASYSKLW